MRWIRSAPEALPKIGHLTFECHNLKDEMKNLIYRGYLWDYAAMEDGKATKGISDRKNDP
ncbi:hypothetical protein TIFTF001_035411 [Ficus carica]|uniref:Uncharacterized protein n=1 Tax=Ficus carica TaxID=3494 RepID=A0AA88E1K2_FICCA|nr:hypothetical protein TIFTF001_035411 [Ficus carica]